MKNAGVTLVELIIVAAIIGILAIALGFSFQGWIGRYKVESTVKQLYADLMTARTQAMQRNSRYFVDFPTQTTYRMSIDDSNGVAKPVPNGSGGDGTFQPQADPAVSTDNTDSTLPTFPKTVAYTINNGVTLTFDPRGLAYRGNPPGVLINPAAVAPDPAAPVTINLISTANPDYDCIIISQPRINIGQMSGLVCNVK